MDNKRKVAIALAIMIILGLLTFSFAANDTDYEIKFYYENGEEVKIDTAIDGKVIKPENPKMEGYTFLGWYTEDDELFDFNTQVEQDTILKAKWGKGENNNSNDNTDNKHNNNNSINNDNSTSNDNTNNNINGSSTNNNIERYTTYTVKHYLMNYTGQYNSTPIVTENFTARVNSDVIGQTNNYVGYTTPIAKSIKITRNGNNVIEYFYALKMYDINIAGNKGITNIKGNGKYYYGEKVLITYDLKPGYSFSNPNTNSYEFIVNDSNNNINLEATPNNDTPYTVKHYLMDEFGNYSKEASLTETFTGITDTIATSPVKSFDHFKSPQEQETIITGDGKGVIEYYYERNKYKLDIVKDEGIESVNGAGEYYYNSEVNIVANLLPGYSFANWSNNDTNENTIIKITDDTVLNAKTTLNTYQISYNLDTDVINNNPNTYTVHDNIILNNPIKEGYIFKGWIGNNVVDGVISKGTTGDIELKAEWEAKNDITYTVKHYQKELDGQYTLVETEKKKGITNSVVTPRLKDYKGFVAPELQTVNIKADGSTLVEYKYDRKQYEITFNAEENIAKMTKYYEEEIGVLPETTKTGYTFKGWYIDEEFTTKAPTTMPATNLNLYAKFTPNTNTPYTIKYYKTNSNGEWVLDESMTETKYGTTDTEVTETAQELVGFTIASSPVTITINGDGTSVINHYYFRNSYNINYYVNTNNSNEIVSNYNYSGNEYRYYDTELAELRSFKALGYDFAGWYLDKELTKPIGNKMPAMDINLYAKWKPANTKYTVRYRFKNTEGKYDDSLDIVEEFDAKTEASITHIPKDFVGFKTPSVKTQKINGNGKTEFLYQYERNRYNIKTAVYVNGIEKSNAATAVIINRSKDSYYNAEVTATLRIHVNPGYVFDKYEIDDQNVTIIKEYDEGIYHYIEFSYKVQKDLNIKVLTKLAEYKITYNLEGGLNHPDNPNSYLCGDNIQFKEPTKEGYSFSYWQTSTGNSIYNTLNQKKDLELTAHWQIRYDYTYQVNHHIMEPDGTYKIVTETKTGSILKPITVSRASNVSSTRFIIPETQEIVINPDGSTVVDYYYDRQQSTIYLRQSGDNAIAPIVKYKGDVIGDLPTPTKHGYIFKGWKYQGPNKEVNSSTVLNQDTYTFIAQWEAILIPYKVIYKYMDINGNWDESLTKIEDKEAALGSTITIKPSYNKTGYETPESQNITIDQENQEVIFEYKRQKFQVTTIVDNNIENISGSGTYYYGSTATIKFTFKDGYAIDKLLINGTNYNITSNEINRTIQNDLEINITSKLKSYRITYVLNGGKNCSDNPKNYTIEDEITFCNPTKEGYDFIGWTNESGDVIKNISKGNTESITLSANWKPSENTPFTVVHKFMGSDGKYNGDDSFEIKEVYYGTTGGNATEIANQHTKIMEHFTLSSSGCNGGSPRTISAKGTTTVTCNYVRKRYGLKIAQNNNLETQINGNQGLYYGSTQVLKYAYKVKNNYQLTGITPLDKINNYTIEITPTEIIISFKVEGNGELELNIKESEE